MNTDLRDSTGVVEVNFRMNSSVVEPGYMDNARGLTILDHTFGNRELLSTFDYMIITAGALPEGNEARNDTLASERALALKSYIMWKFPYVDRSMIYTFSIGEDWDGLRAEIAGDGRMPDKSEVLSMLDSNLSNAEKKVALKQIAGGVAWRYMTRYILPKLRCGAALATHVKGTPHLIETTDTVSIDHVIDEALRADTVKTTDTKAKIEVKVDTVRVDRIIKPQRVKVIRQPLFAIKTNLLFDAALVPNIGVEFHLGRGWSLGAGWMYAWWDKDNSHRYWRIYGGDLGVRKYFGRRAAVKPLTGHHLGLYGQAFTYDFEIGGTGYIGGQPGGTLWNKMNYAMGLEYGYSLPVGRCLNLDLSIGVGYWGGEYQVYKPIDTHYVWQETRQRNWLGPTKAEVSLVWLIGRGNTNQKGGKR
jgi:hypothetical protein